MRTLSSAARGAASSSPARSRYPRRARARRCASLLAPGTSRFCSTRCVRTTICRAAPEKVYEATLKAFADLEIPTGRTDGKAGIIGSERFERSHALGNLLLAKLYNCGEGPVGPYADSFRLEIAVVAWVAPNGHRIEARVGDGRERARHQRRRAQSARVLLDGNARDEDPRARDQDRRRMRPRAKRGLSFDQVSALARELPGVAVSPSYGTPALKVKGVLFARLKEDGETLVLKVDRMSRDFMLERAARPLLPHRSLSRLSVCAPPPVARDGARDARSARGCVDARRAAPTRRRTEVARSAAT